MAIQIDSADAPSGADPANSDEEVLRLAHERIKQAEEAETEIRALALEDLEFRAGKQWHELDRIDRERDGRPCLVVNRLPQFVQQVTNDQRQNRPSIKVHPVDDQADVETAKIIQGLIRHIEYDSSAEVAYDTAFESAANGGFGYWRVVTDFSDPKSFDQDILIKRIRNPFSVFLDPYAQEPDGSDANWGFIVDELPPEEYRAAYPDSKLSQPGADWSAIGNDRPLWLKSESARVAEYFYKDWEETTIHLLSTGETVDEDDLPVRLEAAAQAGLDLQIVKTRKTRVPVIRWLKLNGVEILEQTDWPGQYIPIVPVYGNEIYINGKRILEGIIRNAKDPQRMLNYWKSAETETIALAPRAPYIVAEGQIEGYEEEWETANRRNHAFLTYKPTTVAGQPASPPQRQAFDPNVRAITQASMQAADDLKATTGIYDAALGAQAQETSGIAIQRRNTQTQTSNFHFIDNLTRSLRHTGRILVDLMPHIYDTARAERIVAEDGEQKVVKLNQPTGETGKDGKPLIYRLDVGRYDVTVDVGPSFNTKRQEAVTSMLEVTKAVPQLMQIAGDLLIKNMDWPGAQDIADRMKKMLPPGIADDPKGAQPLPPQVQAQMQQQGQMIEALTQQLHEKSQIVEQKAIERDMLQMELEAKKEMEALRLKTDTEIALAKIDSADGIALLKHQVAELMQREKLGSQLQAQALNAQATQDQSTQDQSTGTDGASGADFGPRGPNPTGGISPGSSMEGN